MKSVQAAAAAEVHPASCSGKTGAFVELELETVLYIVGVRTQRTPFRLEFEYAVVGAYPEESFTVFQDSIDDIVGQPVPLGKVRKTTVALHPVQTATIGGYPKAPFRIFVQVVDEVAADATGIADIETKSGERAGVPVELCQAPAVRGDPEFSVARFEQVHHHIPRDGAFVFRIVPKRVEFSLAQARQSAAVGADPQGAGPVLIQGAYIVVG